MSNIKIVCRKNKVYNKDQKSYEKEKVIDNLGDELVLQSNQLFMSTEKFFNSIKPTLEKYFDEIAKS